MASLDICTLILQVPGPQIRFENWIGYPKTGWRKSVVSDASEEIAARACTN